MSRILLATSFAWAASLPSVPLRGCNAEPPSPQADPGTWMVFVDHVDEEVNPVKWVGDCHPVGSRLDRYDDPADTLPFWQGARPETPCEVRAYQQRGAFRVRSEPVLITEPAAGTTQVVVLELPEGPTGGVGFSFEDDEDGALVLRVFEGSPADDVLQVGDIIVAVDGRVTKGLTAAEFTDASLGRTGTEVTLTWTRRGELHRHTFVREAYALPGSR